MSAGSWQPRIASVARLTAAIFYRTERIGAAVPAGPVLLVANHPNSLMDPALVWATAGRDVRFLAKSTLFKGPSAPLMRAAGAIPVYRRSDAGEDMSRNVEMFGMVQAALAKGDAVCLFPEGKSHSTGRLEQLRTGAARIALTSVAAETPVAIIPVGLNFERKAFFRSRVTVAYGESFGCGDLSDSYRDDPQETVRELTKRIATHLRELMVEADPRSFDEIVARIDRLYSAARGLDRDAESRLRRRRVIAEAVKRRRAEDPEQVAKILEQIRWYDAARLRLGLRERDVDAEATLPTGTIVWFLVREAVLAAALVPIAVAGVAMFAVPYLATDLVARWRAGTEVHASAKVIGGALIYGCWIVLIAILAGGRLGVPSGVAMLVGLPLLAGAALFAIERELTVVSTVRGYFATRLVPVQMRQRISKRRTAIARALDQIYEWLEGKKPGISS